MAETVADVLHLTFTYERTEKPFLHPYRTAAILCEGEVVGYLGQVKYEIMKEEAMREDAYVLEINMKDLENGTARHLYLNHFQNSQKRSVTWLW